MRAPAGRGTGLVRRIPDGGRGTAGAIVAALVAAGCVDIGAPAVSPDGARIAYTRLAGGRSPEVMVLDLGEGPGPGRIARDACRPRWSPAGDRVYCLTAGGSGGVGIASVRPDGSGRAELVPPSHDGVTWYEPSPDGRALLYLREGGALHELDLETSRARRLLGEDQECLAAALDPAAGTIACAVASSDRKGAPGFVVKLVELGGERLVRTLDHFVPDGDAGGRLALLFRPPGREIVAVRDPSKAVWVLPALAGRMRSLKCSRGGEVVSAGVSPDGEWLHVTTVAESDDATCFHHQRVSLVAGKCDLLWDASPVLVGCTSWTAGGAMTMDITPRGLRIATPEGEWRYPASPEEAMAEADALSAEGRHAGAAQVLARAEGDAAPGADVARLIVAQSDAHWKADEGREAIQALLRAYLLHPVSEVPAREFRRRASEMRGDRLMDALKKAFAQEGAKRAETLVEATTAEGNPGFVAGLHFRAAEAHLAAGDALSASRQFRMASESTAFPQADYAAGLAGLAHFASARNDSYAAELMQKAMDLFPASPLQPDFRAALEIMRATAGRALTRSCETTHPSGVSAWVTDVTTRRVLWSLAPGTAGEAGTRRDGALASVSEGQGPLVSAAEERRVPASPGRLGVALNTVRSLWIARKGEREGASVLPDLGIRVASLAFSPKGDMLAFLVEGEAEGFTGPVMADLAVLDLAGRPVVRPAPAAAHALGIPPAEGTAAQRSRAAGRVVSFAWDETGSAIVLYVERMDGGRAVAGSELVRIPERATGGRK